MQTNFQMLRELLKAYHPEEKGIINWSEYKLINDTLHIGEMDILQLGFLLQTKLQDMTIHITFLKMISNTMFCISLLQDNLL